MAAQDLQLRLKQTEEEIRCRYTMYKKRVEANYAKDFADLQEKKNRIIECLELLEQKQMQVIKGKFTQIGDNRNYNHQLAPSQPCITSNQSIVTKVRKKLKIRKGKKQRCQMKSPPNSNQNHSISINEYDNTNNDHKFDNVNENINRNVNTSGNINHRNVHSIRGKQNVNSGRTINNAKTKLQHKLMDYQCDDKLMSNSINININSDFGANKIANNSGDNGGNKSGNKNKNAIDILHANPDQSQNRNNNHSYGDKSLNERGFVSDSDNSVNNGVNNNNNNNNSMRNSASNSASNSDSDSDGYSDNSSNSKTNCHNNDQTDSQSEDDSGGEQGDSDNEDENDNISSAVKKRHRKKRQTYAFKDSDSESDDYDSENSHMIIYIPKSRLNVKKSGHKKGLPFQITPKNPKKCPLPSCHQTFTSGVAFSNHLQTHKNNHDGILLQCDIGDCDRVFATKASLSNHKTRSHSSCNNGAFACRECKKPFETQKKLAKHESNSRKNNACTRPRQKRWQCCCCGKVLQGKNRLVNHLKNIHTIDGEQAVSMAKNCKTD